MMCPNNFLRNDYLRMLNKRLKHNHQLLALSCFITLSLGVWCVKYPKLVFVRIKKMGVPFHGKERGTVDLNPDSFS